MKVSVVVTAYNVEQYIGPCIKSILGQSHQDLELIVVNDCSTDKTLKVLNKVKDERIKIISNDQNMGVGWSRYKGLSATQGEYVIIVDGDDWLGADYIERLVLAAESTGADIVSSGITHVYSEQYEEIKRLLLKQNIGIQKFDDYSKGRNTSINKYLVRRELFAQIPYCTRRYDDDIPVLLALLYYANMVVTIDTQGYFFRQREDRLSQTVSPFERALFHLLCIKDILLFFSDKEEEYQSFVSMDNIKQYKSLLLSAMTPDMEQKYCMELGQLVRLLMVV